MSRKIERGTFNRCQEEGVGETQKNKKRSGEKMKIANLFPLSYLPARTLLISNISGQRGCSIFFGWEEKWGGSIGRSRLF
jgi:hypothetical protein